MVISCLHCLVGVFFEACICAGFDLCLNQEVSEPAEPNLFPFSATALWGDLA